ncbi:MAG: MBL fold metallo-hydrolase [Methylibium sp.]|uniref:MBL fold metallo-hydrolase n=1 Tax=Methylibium sp. TaxID=2067992 RepID=UPI001817FB11|nr:MBL fold metallo-hydrolase [Methylibium sp.]MBA2721711.1 MBL fold metallo-hydrolase [Methylibium sp.]MBA3590188.1 MBL fold metallo-hydrolase [Methylibium sp.]
MVVSQAAPHDDPIVVAPGVYAWIGGTDEAAPENAGVIGNSGFIVGDSGTTVVNTGSSYAHGKRLIAAAERIGGKPVLLAIMTQPLQEFVMGSAAFAERGIPVLAHEASARLVKARCETCLKNLQGILGEEVMQGTRVLAPAQTITATQTREVGGRKLLFWHGGWGATPGDLAVIDVATGVAFSGALVSVRRVPELRDANLAGWRQALTAFEGLPITKLVPGYGSVAGLKAIAAQRGYFDALEHHATDLLDNGASLLEASERADLPAYADWDFYAQAHPRNLQQTYLRLEAAGVGR